jgi:hypothetical protein
MAIRTQSEAFAVTPINPTHGVLLANQPNDNRVPATEMREYPCALCGSKLHSWASHDEAYRANARDIASLYKGKI